MLAECESFRGKLADHLLTQRYWGTVTDWKIHRDGLQRMIDAKGGVEALHENWRLELVVYLWVQLATSSIVILTKPSVSLMSRPSWLESTNNLDRISLSSPILQPHSSSLDVHKVRCLWLISFIQDMRTFMGSFYSTGLSSFPCIHSAVGILRHRFQASLEAPSRDPHVAKWEEEMLVCLFSIAVLLQESMSILCDGNLITPAARCTLDELETLLRDSQHMWEDSAHNLRSILYQSLARMFEEGESKVNYVLDLVQVFDTLSFEARQGVEKCLLNLLYSLGKNNSMLLIDDGWTPDSLLSSIHGH